MSDDSNTIWKLNLGVVDGWHRTSDFRQGAVPLAVRWNKATRTIEVWVHHDIEAAEGIHHFKIVGTGHAAPPQDSYVGTAFDDDYGLVWHVFWSETPPTSEESQ